MPLAPRQSRKGGKIFSPAGPLVEGGTSVVISPGTLLPDTMPCSLPSEPGNGSILEFNFDDIFTGKKSRNPSSCNTMSSAIGADANVLKFDFDAIQKVGQGEVIGAKKSIRTGTRKPQATFESVEEKLMKVIDAQTSSPLPFVEVGSDPAQLAALQAYEVVLVDRPYSSLTLAVATSVGVENAKVLVVVPQYHEVSPVARCLSHLQRKEKVPHEGGVGELCGQFCKGSVECRLWVCNADTALVYLHTQKSLDPFTHVVLPALSRMDHTVAYFLWSLRERFYVHSSTTSSPRVVLCVLEGDQECVHQFFPKQKLITVESGEKREANVLEFTYDESSALVASDVLEVGVDSKGKCPPPNHKLVNHNLNLVSGIVDFIIEHARVPQTIYIFTADTQAVMDALQGVPLPKTKLFTNQHAFESVSSEPSKHHHIFITPFLPNFLYALQDEVHFVLDLGTTRRLSPQSKSESFIVSSLTEWVSQSEIRQHRHLLGLRCVGGYFALYPPPAAAGFAAKDTSKSAMFQVEDAILQCSRAELPAMLASDVLAPSDPDMWEQAQHSLCERQLISTASNVQITFLGEVVSRLPLGLDLGCFVVNGCAIGFGEAAVVIAAVGAFPYLFVTGRSFHEKEAWAKQVMENRRLYAEEVARQSDVLADTLVFLHWCRLKVEGKPTESLIAELQVEEWRLERIRGLVEHLRLQLLDYAFIDSLDRIQTVDMVLQSIKANATTLVFLLSASLARKAAFVHDSGKLNVRDRSATLTFVRTSKKVVPNFIYPTGIPWEVGMAVVSLDLRNNPNMILSTRLSAVSANYLFATLLLLYPQVEYSAPVDVVDKGHVVYFSITCNRQTKRFRVNIEDAARILDFREKWNTALGILQALRLLRRPISHRGFQLALKEENRAFDLEQFRISLQQELISLVTETEISEHQVSFTTHGEHRLRPKEVLRGLEGSEAGDVLMAKRFRTGELWQASSTPMAWTNDKTTSNAASPSSTFVNSPLYEVEDDEIEFITDSYFLNHGPIIDDDE
ncbi:unnamed protein product [Phytomonas sp. EM1]|nr:unnamed protein product [Phytomonas sp. EM1]|eukprot:CCW62172.1 unnamed protein product [Phytomonas sp. isolate EM1]